MFEEACPQSTLDIKQSSSPHADIMEKEPLVPLQLHQKPHLNPNPNLKIEHHRVSSTVDRTCTFHDVSTFTAE